MPDFEFIADAECDECPFAGQIDLRMTDFETAVGDCPDCGSEIRKIVEPA